MRDPSPELIAFATLLKEARKARNVSADDVINATSISRAQYFRFEAAEVANPNLLQVREVCVFLRISPTLAGIALGLLAPEDVATDPVIAEIGRVLAGEMPAASRTALLRALEDAPVVLEICRAMAEQMQPSARAALLHALDGAWKLWRSVVDMQPPIEPSRAELTRRARTAR